ncbi:MAG: ParB N-terminal domain-containing protein [Clostridia bacterium]|nr:ParB N-terminal domain-containing protein [Clostridia bacterium]
MTAYSRTLTTACAFAAEGRIEEWIHTYLCTDGHNKPFSDGLKLTERFYIGPIEMPLSLFTRCCGPEESMQWRVDEDSFNNHVEKLACAVREHADLPPLIVQFTEAGFTLNDGNHRLEAFRRAGVNSYSVIIWGTDPADRERFLQEYREYV